MNEVPEDPRVKQSILRGIPLSDNMFAHMTARRPLARVATGFGVAMAAIATIGLGAGVAAAAPQQPFAADDPIPGVPGAGSAVNITNSLFGSLSGLLNNVIPGAGDLLMPASGALGGGGSLPGGLPGGLARWSARRPRWSGWSARRPRWSGWSARRPSRADPPWWIPGGLPGQTLPGQAPGLGGYPGGLPGQGPGYPGGLAGQTMPGQQLPGQTPGSTVPGGPVPLAPGQGHGAAGPVAPAQAPLGQPAGQPGPVASASANGNTLAHVPVV